MWNQFSDIAPKAAVAAAVLWAGTNYVLIGPEVAARVARADHIPVCEANFHSVTINVAEQRIAALPRPTLDTAKEMAAEQLRQLREAPFMGELNRMGLGGLLGIDRTMDVVGAQYEHQKREAIDAYNQAVEHIKAETATELGKAGSVCGSVADAAISETRTEWAIFTGTLGLIRPAPLKAFDDKMLSIYRAGRYAGAKAGS